jgi:hypothetical protein
MKPGVKDSGSDAQIFAFLAGAQAAQNLGIRGQLRGELSAMSGEEALLPGFSGEV